MRCDAMQLSPPQGHPIAYPADYSNGLIWQLTAAHCCQVLQRSPREKTPAAIITTRRIANPVFPLGHNPLDPALPPNANVGMCVYVCMYAIFVCMYICMYVRTYSFRVRIVNSLGSHRLLIPHPNPPSSYSIGLAELLVVDFHRTPPCTSHHLLFHHPLHPAADCNGPTLTRISGFSTRH